MFCERGMMHYFDISKNTDDAVLESPRIRTQIRKLYPLYGNYSPSVAVQAFYDVEGCAFAQKFLPFQP
jgi:hypothetical protein